MRSDWTLKAIVRTQEDLSFDVTAWSPVISTEHEGAKRLRGSGEIATTLAPLTPTQGILPRLCPRKRVSDASLLPAKSFPYARLRMKFVYVCGGLLPLVRLLRFRVGPRKHHPRSTGRTPRIGIVVSAASGSLHTASVSRSAGSFVLGRDDRSSKAFKNCAEIVKMLYFCFSAGRDAMTFPVPSFTTLMRSIFSPVNSSSSFPGPGQRTCTESIVVAAPSPKWRRISLLEL